MGQKVNPNGIRLGINRTWSSRWFSKSEYSKLLHQDLEIKKYVENKLKNASISKVNIERAAKKLRISIYSSRPGIIIGKKGADIENLKNKLTKLSNLEVFLDIKEVRKPEVEAKLVAENIASQLEKRVSFRRAMKKSVQSSMRLGAKGVKIHTMITCGKSKRIGKVLGKRKTIKKAIITVGKDFNPNELILKE